jgi:Pvc16 N-terminal domain/Carboxypeptidase regulatory-like domain
VATATGVPLNTMLADLDESLRALLKRELGRHGFDGVEIAFDAPDKEWAASLSAPAVNLFLYDLREAKEVRPIDWEPEPSDERRERRPPLRVDASYAVTAWTRAVEDEHRLLSQALAILYAHPQLGDGILTGALANGSQRYPIKARTAQERHEDASDFWNAVGGQYKASFNYVVTLSCEAGTAIERGPEVRTQTIRVRDRDAGPATVLELNRSGGVVLGTNGEPQGDVWVLLLEKGAIAVTDDNGRFRFDRLTAGSYRLRARSRDGEEATATLTVPGQGAELKLAPAKATASKRSR